jgi:hypothetical protein
MTTGAVRFESCAVAGDAIATATAVSPNRCHMTAALPSVGRLRYYAPQGSLARRQASIEFGGFRALD